MEGVALKSGTKLVHVPYQGSPAAMTAILRNDVQMAVLPAISVTPHVAAGGPVKILAVSLPRRSAYLPDVPTLKESGVDVEADTWQGLIAPGGTPPAMVDKINKDIVEAITSPAVKEKLATQFMEPVGNSPAQFRAVIEAEKARWAPIVKDAGVKIN
jgi:tripartite-type tricarboxylate transporter receptor subunit TctC